MPKRKNSAARSWEEHESMLHAHRAHRTFLRNTYSRHLAPWRTHVQSPEDQALRMLPAPVKSMLQDHMMEVMPPSECLQTIRNRQTHDNMSLAQATDFMLNTLVLMQLAFLLEHYGNEHPNVQKLIAYSNRITARNTP